jgi:hypothetical protein
MTGNVFQATVSASEVGEAGIGVDVRVGAGVIGENCLGLGVSVGRSIYARAGNVSVGGAEIAGAEVPCPTQEVIKTQTNKVSTRFIAVKYSGE